MMTEYDPLDDDLDHQQHDQPEHRRPDQLEQRQYDQREQQPQQHDQRNYDHREQQQQQQPPQQYGQRHYDHREQQQPPPQQHYDQREHQQQPRSIAIERGRAIKLMRNGDLFFPGRAFVINQRKYPMLDVFLDDASQALSANFGAVRYIYTPKNGTRLHDISQLEDHRTYVAAGGERFKRLQYYDIAEGKRVPFKERASPKLPPVRRFDVEGRAVRLSRTENVIIYVYRNGDPLTLPAKILFVKATLQNWESVLDEITRKISLTTTAVLKLYAMNGELITSAQQLEYGGMYVAAGKERFKRIEYPDPKTFSPNSSPKLSRKSYTKSDGTNTNTTTNTANSHGSTEHIRNRRPVREEYDFFNSKPHQPRRGPTKETDLDRDDGGIYKGRLNHRERVREIDETKDTKVDLPVDYREIETVEEENVNGNAVKTTRRHPQPPSQPKTKQPVANSRHRSPPVRSKLTLLQNEADDDDHKNMNNNNQFAINNGHQRSDSHHEINNNDYDPYTPSVPPEIDDDRDIQEIPHLYDRELPDSYDQEQILSPNVQAKQEENNHAATVIQSHVRGYLTRKQVHHEKQENTDQLTKISDQQDNTDQLTNNHDQQENIDQLTNNNDQQQQQQQEADKHEENKLDQHPHSPQTNESQNSMLESLVDLIVQQAITEALVVDDNKEEEKRRHDDDDDDV